MSCDMGGFFSCTLTLRDVCVRRTLYDGISLEGEIPLCDVHSAFVREDVFENMQEEIVADTVQLNAIPPEVVSETIFPYLHPIELWQCRRVCRTWQAWIKVYFRTLRVLNFSDPISEYYLTSYGLYSVVQSLQFLKVIKLDNCQHSVTVKTLTCLANRCHRLEVLCAPCCREVTDDVLRAIAGNCPRLKELNISRCFQVRHCIIRWSGVFLVTAQFWSA